MALAPDKLTDIQAIAATATSVLVNLAGQRIYLKGIILHNTNTSIETVQIYNVPDNTGLPGTAAVLNRFLNPQISGGDTVFIEMPYPIVLSDTGDAIFAQSTTANKVTLQLLGEREVS